MCRTTCLCTTRTLQYRRNVGIFHFWYRLERSDWTGATELPFVGAKPIIGVGRQVRITRITICATLFDPVKNFLKRPHRTAWRKIKSLGEFAALLQFVNRRVRKGDQASQLVSANCLASQDLFREIADA